MKTEKRIPAARRAVGDLLLALTVLLTADVVIVMLRKIQAVVLKADYQNIFNHELVLCAILLLFALDFRFGLFTLARIKALRAIGWLLRIAVILFTAVTLFFCGRVVVGSLIDTAAPTEHVIVLGMALENGKPTKDLLSRLDTAQAYLQENPDAKLILTGGNADESGRTEAAVMRDFLVDRGVPQDGLLLEDRATTTEENFANTARMLPTGEPVLLISSNYHMDRAVRTAEAAGFDHVLRLPAPSDPLTYGSNMMWEVIMALNELLN